MAMERLISSPLLPRRPPRAAFSRPPPSLAAAPPHHRAGGAASGYGSRPPLASLLLSRHHHHHQPPVLAANPAADVAAGEAVPPATATASRRFLQKVASAAAATLLATIALTLIQPAWAPPALASFHSAAKAGGGIFKSELLSSAWTGFLAGCLHTLSGPDHLAALAPLSIGRSRVESAAVGALWGCGHDAGQVIFGLLFLSLKDRLHIEVIRTWGTRVVGLTLLVIGALGIREATRGAHAVRRAGERRRRRRRAPWPARCSTSHQEEDHLRHVRHRDRARAAARRAHDGPAGARPPVARRRRGVPWHVPRRHRGRHGQLHRPDRLLYGGAQGEGSQDHGEADMGCLARGHLHGPRHPHQPVSRL
ncbi:hypothetical protein OsJ_19909 [Oryza sativa Japonica Group]|uniref:Uncharacterized protein n=1 Tax=Oryza sativa subsp. japonica TaxID=39947 RepID=B9FR78_ORYSJ|nr:hypothetical protein OsJ_19909 [Oryza sativa Japonica Group]